MCDERVEAKRHRVEVIDAVSEEERERIIARRAYKKQWRAKNRERVAEYDRRFWDKQAESKGK